MIFSHASLIGGHYQIMSALFFTISAQYPTIPFQPYNTRWMNAAERRLAQARLAEDAGEADKDNAEDS